MRSTNLFTSMAQLLQYDCVILANTPRATGETIEDNESFSDTQIRMLVRNCEEMGAGLIMLGGDRAFGAGGWTGTELEKAMPVDFQIKNDKIDAVGALVLMMHACEMADGNYWQTQIARKSIEVLGPMDFCGVVEWSNMATPRWLWKMPKGVDRIYQKRKTMMGLVGRMQMGDMPDFNAPMRLALNGLKNTKASVKHMIIISDGDPTAPSNRLLADYVKNKIKISTVLIGNHSLTTPMQRIAKVTGGRYYPRTNPKALPKIFQREARRVAKPVIKESESGMGVLTDSIGADHEILQGIDTSELPGIFGYVMTTIKKSPLVEQLAITTDPADNRENTTLLATWRYGIGRATVFTSDAGQKWTAEWLGSEFYEKLFTQMVRHSMRPITESANFNVGTEVKDGKAKIVVNALDDDEEFLNFLNMSARGVSPDLQGFDLDFSQVGPGRYTAEIDVNQSGNYLFSIFPGEGYERLTTGVNVPYSSEFSDRQSNLVFLDSLVQFDVADGEKGEIIRGDLSDAGRDDLLSVNTFRPTLSNKVGIHDIWPFLVVLCGTVFFADVFIRRVAVNFEFISEYI
ncbi:MAG: glutamine amidotransferase, partial [Planctomycetota bacterium]